MAGTGTPKQVSGLIRERGIRERSPGHFELAAFDAATGRQVFRTFVAPQKGSGIRAVRRELAKLRTEIAEGRLESTGKGTTLATLLDEYLRHSEARGRSPSTLGGYAVNAAKIKAGPLARKPIAKLTAHDLDAYYSQLRSEGMSPATVHHHHRLIRAALSQAERWGWVSRNVAALASPPTSPKPELTIPTWPQVVALAERASKTSVDLGAVILFAALTGLRRGEICGLQWSDVDWPGQRLTVRRSVWEVASRTGVKGTKTGSVRRIALDPVLLSLLTARCERAKADAEAARLSSLPSNAYVWATVVDGSAPRTPDSVSRSFAHICSRMARDARPADGVAEGWAFNFHSLRHLSATSMVGAGVDVRTVAARLGHADPSVTLRIYAHALEGRDRDAAEGLGRALAAAPPK